MNRKKISELAKQVRGVSYKPEDLHNGLDQNSVVLLRANNIDDGKINFDEVEYVDKSKVSKEQYLQKGDILICASSGSKQLVGKAATVSFEKECTFGAFCKVVRPLPAFADYLGAFFQSNIYRKTISEVAIGANINNIRNEHIDYLEIPVGTADENNEKVAKIRLLQSIIENRKHELQSLDDLIKARFVEMFGNPLKNDKGWKTVAISDACQRIFGGGTPSKSHPEYFEGTIPWISPKDMKSDVISDSIDHITEEAIKNSTTNIVPSGSVLMVIRSGILKHSLPVAINSVPVTINQDMKAFIPGKGITACFLRNYFIAIEPDVLSGVRGVTADNIDFKSFQQRQMIIPPIALQNEYYSFCNQIDKSKFAVQKALDKAQLLFDSLMQQYFG